MYDDTGPVGGPSRFILILIILVIVVMGITVALNGNTTNQSNQNVSNETVTDNNTTTISVQQNTIANETIGSVVKYSTYGNVSSDIRIAIVIGMDSDGNTPNSVIPTMESMNDLKYAYDIYMINSTNSVDTSMMQDAVNGNQTNESSANDSSDNQSDLSVNNRTRSLASQYVVPDIENNEYNFTIDIQSTNDSNSYIFVPSSDTYTSRLVVNSIANSTDISKYNPGSPAYAKSLSIPLIERNIASMVYVSSEYATGEVSGQEVGVITAIDNFDFVNLESGDNASNQSDTANNTTDANNQTNATNDTNSTNQTDTNLSVNVTTSEENSNETSSSNSSSSSNSTTKNTSTG